MGRPWWHFGLICAILVALIIWLQYQLWYGSHSVGSVLAVERDVKEMRAHVAYLVARNDAIYREVKSLKQSDDVIAKRARADLGLIGVGETFYQIQFD